VVSVDGLGWFCGSDRRRERLYDLDIVMSFIFKMALQDYLPFRLDHITYTDHTLGFLERQNFEVPIHLLVQFHEELMDQLQFGTVHLKCLNISICCVEPETETIFLTTSAIPALLLPRCGVPRKIIASVELYISCSAGSVAVAAR